MKRGWGWGSLDVWRAWDPLSICLSLSACLPFVSCNPPDREEGEVATPCLSLDAEWFPWASIPPWGSASCLFCWRERDKQRLLDSTVEILQQLSHVAR